MAIDKVVAGLILILNDSMVFSFVSLFNKCHWPGRDRIDLIQNNCILVFGAWILVEFCVLPRPAAAAAEGQVEELHY